MIGSKNKTYFTKGELECKCCGKCNLTKDFEEHLLALRIIFGRSMKVNSCFRCEKHNKDIGGAKSSYHVKGMAIDIAIPDGQYRADLATKAFALGWSVGTYKTFLHLDRRKTQTSFQG